MSAVGFNPLRPQKRRTSDHVMVVAALVVVTALVVWGVWPR